MTHPRRTVAFAPVRQRSGQRMLVRLTAVTLAASAAGCLGDVGVVCEDGTTCPDQTTCSIVSSGEVYCATEAELAACDVSTGLVDEDPCVRPSGTAGVCNRGVCVAAGCGNLVLEGDRGEICDDGNQVGGDTCNATCSSTGDCGNGQVDIIGLENAAYVDSWKTAE